jgi:hypothetical protein
MHAAAGFLEIEKKRCRQWLQMGIPLQIFKSGSHLFACRAMGAHVSDTAFPILAINS